MRLSDLKPGQTAKISLNGYQGPRVEVLVLKCIGESTEVFMIDDEEIKTFYWSDYNLEVIVTGKGKLEMKFYRILMIP